MLVVASFFLRAVVAMNTRHPLFSCGFRPFFVFTAASAVVFLAVWLLVLQGAAWLSGWQPPGGAMLWHGHEMICTKAGKRMNAYFLEIMPTANLAIFYVNT